MSTFPLPTKLAAMTVAALWAMPATACYTGPMPMAFNGRTAQLSKNAKERLAYYSEMRGINGRDRLLVIFYGPPPQRPSDKELLRKRKQTVRGYLLYKGVLASAFSIVTTKRTLPTDLRELDPGSRQIATVELTIGCSG